MDKKRKNFFYNVGAGYTPSDADALTYVTNAGITDNTQKQAANTLIVAVKGLSLWTPCKFMHPILGGAASSHKFNAKDPRDLDAAYRLNIQGGWTHSANGMQPNGTTGYADIFFNPLTEWGVLQNKGAIGFYSRTQAAGAGYDMAVSDAVENLFTGVIARYTGGALTDQFFAELGTINYTGHALNTDGRGFFMATRKSGFNLNDGYRNGSLISSDTEDQTLPNFNLYLGAGNKGGTAAFFANKQYAFACGFNRSLTAQENLDLYTAVQAFQTSLGRQV